MVCNKLRIMSGDASAKELAKNVGRVDNVWSGHRDDSFEGAVRSELEDHAVTALSSRASHHGLHHYEGLNSDTESGALVAVAASVGVVLSRSLLHVGFGQAYQVLNASEEEPGITFPGRAGVAIIDFLYFSFVIGTSFAASRRSARSAASAQRCRTWRA